MREALHRLHGLVADEAGDEGAAEAHGYFLAGGGFVPEVLNRRCHAMLLRCGGGLARFGGVLVGSVCLGIAWGGSVRWGGTFGGGLVGLAILRLVLVLRLFWLLRIRLLSGLRSIDLLPWLRSIGLLLELYWCYIFLRVSRRVHSLSISR